MLGAEEDPNTKIFSRDTASSVLAEKIDRRGDEVPCRMRRLDKLIDEEKRPVPQFVKIDTQGYEYPILVGLGDFVDKVEVYLIETNLIDIHQGVALAHDVIKYLTDRGFVLFDIAEIHRRPLDSVVWQIDFVFIKEDSPLRSDKRWGK